MNKGVSGRHYGFAPVMESSFFLCAAVVLGGIAGCMLAIKAAEESSIQLTSFLTTYIKRAVDSNISVPCYDFCMQWGQRLGLAFLIECSVLRIIGLPIFLFLQGYIIGFAVSCFVCVFGFPGLLIAMTLLGAPALCFFSGVFCIRWQLSGRFKPPQSKEKGSTEFWTAIGICLFDLALIVLLECVLVIKLFPAAARVVATFHIV